MIGVSRAEIISIPAHEEPSDSSIPCDVLGSRPWLDPVVGWSNGADARRKKPAEGRTCMIHGMSTDTRPSESTLAAVTAFAILDPT